MKVYLNNTLDLYQGLSTNEVIGAFVSEKVEGGFKININGIDVFAHSLLDFNIGDYLKLKIVEASPSKMVLKLIQQDINELDQAKSPLPYNIPQSPQAETALLLLSKLNLHIKKERLLILKNLLDEFVSKEAKENNKPINIKDYLALKALNLAHDKLNNEQITFFAMSTPVYQRIYIKVTGKTSAANTKSLPKVSFVVNTQNLGTILVNLTYINGNIKASSTFEDKNAMEVVKEALTHNKDLGRLLRTMKLNVGKVSYEDFFFEGVEKRKLATGINLII